MDSDLKKQTYKAIKWTVVGKVVGQVISWLSTIIVIRYLTPTDYGLMAMAEVMTSFLLVFSYIGISEVLVQKKEITNIDIRQVFTAMLVVNIALFFFTVGFSGLVSEFYKEERVREVIIGLSLIFLFYPFVNLPKTLLQREMDFKSQSLVELGAGITGAITSLIMAIMGFGVWSLVVGMLANAVVKAIMLNVIRPSIYTPTINFQGSSELMKFGFAVSLTGLVMVLLTRIDVAIGGRYLSTAEIGIYGVAIHLARMPMSKIMPFATQILYPVFSRLKEDTKVLEYYINKSLRIISISTFPIFFGMASVSESLVTVLLGNEWKEVSLPLFFLTLTIPFRIIMNMFPPMLRAVNKPGLDLNNSLVSLLLLTAGLSIGVIWGIIGMCIAWLVVLPFAFTYSGLKTSRCFNMQLSKLVSNLMPATIASVMMLGIVKWCDLNMLFNISVYIKFPILVVTGGFTYILVLFVFFANAATEYRDFVLNPSLLK